MNHPSQKSVKQLFEADTCFRIPEYQREYCWDEERCRSLWNDLVAENQQKDVFLGTFVTNTKNEEKTKYLDVVDGQQRVTTFYLILRAGLQYLSEQIGDIAPNTKKIIDEDAWSDLRNELKGALWMKNSAQKRDAKLPRLIISSPFDSHKADFSDVIASFYDKNSTYFCDLENCDLKKKSLYIQNLFYFYSEFKKKGVQDTFTALNRFLDNFRVLHLNCDDEEEALIVFDTLNNRGIQLKDADIFKSHLYKSCSNDEQKDDFIATWNSTLIKLKEIGNNSLVIDELFHQYVLYVKLKTGDKRVDRDVQAVRNFYLDRDREKGKYLENHREEIMNDIGILADMWYNLSKRVSFSFEVLKWYHCLQKGKNNLWMWAVATYYLCLKNNKELSEDEISDLFGEFLKKLTAGIYYKCLTLEGAASDNIKQFVFNVINNIGRTKEPKEIFTFDEDAKQYYDLDQALKNMACGTKGDNPTNDKPFVFIHAYLNPQQKELLPLETDVEHIFPKSWSKKARGNSGAFGLKEGEMDDKGRQYVQYFGNKICLEKSNNILCSDDFFANKLDFYEKGKASDKNNPGIEPSKIQDIKDFCINCRSKGGNPCWKRDDITARNDAFTDKIIQFFNDNIIFSGRKNY